MINEIKQIVDHYLNSTKQPAILIGTYDGTKVAVNEKFSIPMSLITGNMKGKLISGDGVRLLAVQGWGVFFVLVIIGRPYEIGG